MKDGRFKLIGAVHLFLIREGRVLLARRCNTGYEDGRYGVPAGHLDGGEEVRAAAAREAREELGITVAPADLTVAGVMHRRAPGGERVDFFLTAGRWSGEIVNAEPHKCDDLRWCALAALPKGMVPYVRRALDNWRGGVWYDAHGWD